MMSWFRVACIIVVISVGHARFAHEEGSCLSMFDYSYKVIQQLVQLTEGQEKMSQQIQSQTKQLNAAQQRQEELSETIRVQSEQLAASDQRQQSIAEQTAALESAKDGAVRTLTALERKLEQGGGEGQGSTYIRWGRTSCPGNGTELVYSGYAGGSYFNHKGAAASYLCLPQDPLWGKYDDSTSDDGLVYGAEYQAFGNLFSGIKQYYSKVPCAVCTSPRPSALMIPARNECYDNWTLEYHGYLMAGYYSHNAASEYVCVDSQPESAGGESTNNEGKLFYKVEARCGALKCPPYVNGRELTCVVCSK